MYDSNGRMRFPEKGCWQSKKFNAATRQAENDQKYLMKKLKEQSKLNLKLQEDDNFDRRFNVKPQTSVSFVKAPSWSPRSTPEKIFPISPRFSGVRCRGTDVENYDSPPKHNYEQITKSTLSSPHFPRKRAKSTPKNFRYFTQNTDGHKSAWMTQDHSINPGCQIEGWEEGNIEEDFGQQKDLLRDNEEESYDFFKFHSAPLIDTRSIDTKRRPLVEKRTVLPKIEDNARISLFKKKFPRSLPTSIIKVGKWRIPIHLDAIKELCPALVEKMFEQRDQEESKLKSARWTPYRDPKTPRKKVKKANSKFVRRYTPAKHSQRYDVRKRIQELKTARERRTKTQRKIRKPDGANKPYGVNVYKIDAPARSVIEFLNFVYPQQELRMGTLLTPSELFGLARLCVDYDVWDERVLKLCVERLRVLLKKEDLKSLLSMLDDKIKKEFEQEVAERLGTMLIQGELSNKDLKTIGPKVWRLLLTASTWNKGLSKTVNSGKLIAQVLIWVINSMDGVKPNFLAKMLDIVSGFPENSDSCRSLAMAVHSQEKVMGLTNRLRPELQIIFWRKISEYFYAAARTHDMLAQLPVSTTKLGEPV